MARVTENKKSRQANAVKLSRDMRGIPASAYRMPRDGRKWKTLCDQRKQLADWLGTYGDADGTRIFPGVDTMLAAFDTWSRSTVFRRLRELRELGTLLPEGRKGENGPRIRRLIPLNSNKAEVSDSVQDSTRCFIGRGYGTIVYEKNITEAEVVALLGAVSSPRPFSWPRIWPVVSSNATNQIG